MARKNKDITDILVEMGVIDAATAKKAVADAQKMRKPIEDALVELKVATEEEVTKALAIQYDMEYIDIDKSMLAASNFHIIPQDLIKRHQVLLPLLPDLGQFLRRALEASCQ